MHLADMTGVELIKKLRDSAPQSSTGYILIASQPDASADSAVIDPSAAVRLSKPFDLDRLAKAIVAATSASPTGASRRGELRVLLVDDSAVARRHVRTVLANLGIRHFSEAGDGAEALLLLGHETFDLIVTDYNMPYLDGRALIDFIRRRISNPSVPVIVVTTETSPAKLEAVRQLGVAGICDKSFDAAFVGGILDKLDRSETRR